MHQHLQCDSNQTESDEPLTKSKRQNISKSSLRYNREHQGAASMVSGHTLAKHQQDIQKTKDNKRGISSLIETSTCKSATLTSEISIHGSSIDLSERQSCAPSSISQRACEEVLCQPTRSHSSTDIRLLEDASRRD